MELAPPRGTQDLLSDRADAMFGLYEAAHRTADLFGFRYVETPMFEHTELFARTSGETSDVVTKEMYTFEDKGGRSLTLRPESSASVMRAYLTHAQELPNPFKAYYVGSEFRHGRPQAGRLREFRQFGIEVIGVEGAAADVEVVVLGERYLQERGLRRYRPPSELDRGRGLPARVSRDARRLLRAVSRPARRGLPDAAVEEPVARVRLQGGRREGLRARRPDDRRSSLRRVRDALRGGARRAGRGGRRVRARSAAGAGSGLLHAHGVRVGVDRADIATRRPPVERGGRYDGLAEALGGPPTPGVGFAMGLDRVLLAIEAEGVPLPPVRTPRCFVVAIGEAARRAGARLVADLRDGGLGGRGAFEERPLKAQLKMADRPGPRSSPSWGTGSSRAVPSRSAGWSTAYRSRCR